jgi:hypothetical protein
MRKDGHSTGRLADAVKPSESFFDWDRNRLDAWQSDTGAQISQRDICDIANSVNFWQNCVLPPLGSRAVGVSFPPEQLKPRHRPGLVL